MIDYLSFEGKKYREPERMAANFLAVYFKDGQITYPINPFQMLKDMNVLFSFRNFKNLEGLYIPPENKMDLPVVGININRPITRQRFTAAHELCHHLRDKDKQVVCPIGKKDSIEYFADSFASAILMPYAELQRKIDEYADETGKVDFDGVLYIADYFGVSFEACVYRIAYTMQKLKDCIERTELKKRIKSFFPNMKRKKLGLTYADLYCDLIDSFEEEMQFIPDDHVRLIFMNQYIYNDSRMEGLNVTLEQASEIVTDLRMNMQNSRYCSEENEVYMSIAGHYLMYQHILETPVKADVSIYNIVDLNKYLYQYYPFPEFGGKIRDENLVIKGAKFEVVDFRYICKELDKLEIEIQNIYKKKDKIKISEYIKHVVRMHHMITKIHPFSDGNGRTTRAFMNIQLIRRGLPPLYIKVKEKKEYLDALEVADTKNNYDSLYEVIFKIMLRCNSEISQSS